MSFFDKVTKRVQINKDNWVDIQELSYGDSKSTMASAMSMTQSRKGEPDKMHFDPGIIQMETMIRSIVAWGGDDFAGREVNRENILALPQWVAEKISDAIDSINEGISEDEKNA